LGKSRPWLVGRAAWRLSKSLKEVKPHVVVGTLAFINRLIGLVLKRTPVQTRWIARFAADPAFVDNTFLRSVTGYTCSRADCYVGNSQGLAAALSEYYPFIRGRALHVPNPADFDMIDRLADEEPDLRAYPEIPVLISVGRLDRQKRPDILVEAFARVRCHAKATLWIVGEGPERKSVESLVQKHGLRDNVRMLGFCRNPYSLMRQAAVFVLTSDYEGLPNALIEAQGLGVPAVATRCPYGPDEIVKPEETGILSDVGDSDAIAEGILRLLSDPERRRKMGNLARNNARRLFNKTAVMQQWEDLIRFVAEGQNPWAE
jgi:glycosyltransferase involved in cell wall biosynthesis